MYDFDDCQCAKYDKSCCTCVSFGCHCCFKQSEYKQGDYCSACGRPLTKKAVDALKNRIYIQYKSMLDMIDNAEKKIDEAIKDLTEIMLRGGNNIDTCNYCTFDGCYARGGYLVCNPKWRGLEEE